MQTLFGFRVIHHVIRLIKKSLSKGNKQKGRIWRNMVEETVLQQASNDSKLTPKEQFEDLLNKRAALQEGLNSLERQIYACEANYLEETQPYGNIIIGFDNYVSSLYSLGSRSRQTNLMNKRQKFQESHRIFSNSSATYLKALGIKDDISGIAMSSDSISSDMLYGGNMVKSDISLWKKGRKKTKQKKLATSNILIDKNDEFGESVHTATIEPVGPRKLRLKLLTSNNYVLSR
jgi:hypothetical protein